MSQTPEPRHTPDNDEPQYIPSQAEGDPAEPLNEHLRTPGQAEGERYSALEDTQPGRMMFERESSSPGGLWERVKALIGLGRK